MPQRFCWRCGSIQPYDHKHRSPRPDTENRRATKGIGERGRAWRRVRAEFIRDHPVCQHPEGCIAPATQVHHIDGQGPVGERGLDPSNLLACCASHHSAIEAATARPRDDEGRWVAA